ncbi:MAG: adenylate/guanylate cyclase domain-containing protein [Dehalococcoidia bacterium]
MTDESTLLGEERRLVTVLFADLVGYTAASEARDPELIFDALNLCMSRLGNEIQRFGGYVDKVVGDEIMGLFGAPRAQEDDAGKAIAAGLAMQRALAELAPELEGPLGTTFRMRVGINTGLVLAGAVGPGGYTVTGDAINVGARLESAAAPGTILVGESTRRLARRPFRWGEQQELTVKGRSEPVVCVTVEGAATAPLRLVPAPSETPFVGRQEHLERIKELWGEAAAGEARVLQIAGESGIGKTRLLAHLFANVDVSPEHVLYTRTDTPPRTFGPLLQLLPALRDNLPEGFEERIEALARVHETEIPPEVEPNWLVNGLTEVLRTLSASGPVALVLDDMHRADRATIEIVDKLLPRLRSMPVLTLLLRQPVGRRVRRVSEEETVTLEPLSPEQGRALAKGVARSLGDDAATQIVARAGGNPLYLEMLATAAANAPEGVAVSESLQTAVVARIDELDETSRRVLREASVFGVSFYEEPLKLTTTVTDGLYETLGHLCEVGLLDDMGDAHNRGYTFRHTLVQEVLYEGLTHRQRAELHRRAAEALELAREEGLDVEPEQMAFHFSEAGDGERAAAYHLAAAERADQLWAPVEARGHRRSANRLLNSASLAGLYATNGRPSLVARAGAIALQAALAAALILPAFLVVATRRPEQNLLTLGLPYEIIDFHPSAIFVAVLLGGLPLLVAGILFAHLAVPLLMKRAVSPVTLAGVALAGWAVALLSVLIGFGALIGLLRLGWLDRLSSMYVGGATLQLLLGKYTLLITVIVGTLVVAIVWTALLRVQTRGWARLRRSTAGPKEIEEGRRWTAVRQLGLLATAVGGLTVLLLAAYEFGLLPNSDAQPSLGAATFGAVVLPFAAMTVGGAGAGVFASRKLRSESGANQLGLFGFEVPLVLALAFGLVLWFGMRQAVIVSANDVDTPGSVAAFDRAVELFPDLSLAHYLRGERFLAEHDFERARDSLTRAIELDDEFPASYFARGRVLIGLGDTEGAIADGTRVIELRPDHPGGYAIRAWAYAIQGDLEAAADDVALAVRPLDANARVAWDAYFIRCLALVAMERLDEAEQDCQQALDQNPGHIVSLDGLAQIAAKRAQASRDAAERQAYYEEAIGYTIQVLEVDPESSVALANLGRAYLLIGRYEEAEAELTKALESDALLVRGYLDRGHARILLGKSEDAMADVDRGVELYWGDPTSVHASSVLEDETYGTRMYVSRYAGDYAQAIEDATALEELGYGTAFVLTMRGASYLASGDVDRALADINRALSLNRDYAPAFDGRGYASYLQNDFASAEADLDAALDRLITMSPQERAELHYHRGLLFQAQGRSTLAMEELDEAANLVEVPSVRDEINAARDSLVGAG